MEASALHAPAGLTRLSLGPLLRLRSDEQLVALFRSGSDDAFSTLVDRYQQRLFAYVRQMLGGSRQDAEDVLQDVFVRAYSALRADARDINVRAWLYRVAHNRCIDQLRRPTPAPSEIFEMSRKPLHDPIEQAQMRDDLRRLVEDVGRLPEQQRSALLMREIDGMAYADLAAALDTTVPAVKSLLVRARVGLAEAVEARDMDCAVIRVDLAKAYDKGVKASGRARRHMRECDGCREYRVALRGVRRSFAALTPLGAGPLALFAQALGIGGAGGGAAASAGAGGGGLAATTGIGAVSACKVAAVVCTAAIATGGAAVEVKHLTIDRSSAPSAEPAASKRAATTAPAPAAAAAVTAAPRREAVMRSVTAPATHEKARTRQRADKRTLTATPAPAQPGDAPRAGLQGAPATPGVVAPDSTNGGAKAPADDAPATGTGTDSPAISQTTPRPGETTAPDPAAPTQQQPAQQGTAGAATGGANVPAPVDPASPPPEH